MSKATLTIALKESKRHGAKERYRITCYKGRNGGIQEKAIYIK